MYSNGYVPPQPPVQRRRRSERNTSVQGTEAPRDGIQARQGQIASSNQARHASAQGTPWQGAVPNQAQQAVSPQARTAGQPWTYPQGTPQAQHPGKKQHAQTNTFHAAAQGGMASNDGTRTSTAQRTVIPMEAYTAARHGGRAAQGQRPAQPLQSMRPTEPTANHQSMNGQRGYQPMTGMGGTAWQGQPAAMGGASPTGRNQGYYQSQPTGPWQQPQARYDKGMNQQPVWQQGNAQQQSGWQQPVPPIGMQPPGPPHGGGTGGKTPRSVGRTIMVAFLCLVVVAGLAVGGYYAWQDNQVKQYVTAYDTVFCQGVYVDGIHLGGMTQQEGLNAVTTQAQQRNDAWSVRLTYQGQLVTQITADQLGMKVDVADTLNAAWSQGHTGDVYLRKEAMEQLLTTPYEGFTALPGGDTSVIDNILTDIRNNVYRAPQDATVSFDPSKTEPFTFQNEVAGRILDTAPIKEQLYHMVSTLESGDIEIMPQSIQPQVTVADLKKQVALRGTASTDISTRSTENRTNNIRRCFELINGYVLKPGNTFSFNNVVGMRTEKNGFFEADEYVRGEVVSGIGGGSCQASTTLYQAAVRAGMKITEREPHSMEVNYCEYGKDATVYWYSNHKIDLAFRNTTDSPVYIVASVQSNPSNRKRLIAKVSIYGADLGNISYDIDAEITEILPAPTEPKYVRDTKQQYVTYTDEEQVVVKSKDGLVVTSYLVTYENGRESNRTKLFEDTYKPKQETIYVGTQDREI